jgi:hypothetical protein
MKKFIEVKSSLPDCTSLFYDYIDYESKSIHFNVFCSKSICVGSEKEAQEIESLIDIIEPDMEVYSKSINFTGTPVKKIIRESLDKLTNYNCGIFAINRQNCPEPKLGEYLVKVHKKKYDAALQYCQDFLKVLEEGGYHWGHWKEIEDYNNHVAYFEFPDMPNKEEVNSKLGQHPLDKISEGLTKIRDILLKENEGKNEE